MGQLIHIFPFHLATVWIMYVCQSYVQFISYQWWTKTWKLSMTWHESPSGSGDKVVFCVYSNMSIKIHLQQASIADCSAVQLQVWLASMKRRSRVHMSWRTVALALGLVASPHRSLSPRLASCSLSRKSIHHALLQASLCRRGIISPAGRLLTGSSPFSRLNLHAVGQLCSLLTASVGFALRFDLGTPSCQLLVDPLSYRLAHTTLLSPYRYKFTESWQPARSRIVVLPEPEERRERVNMYPDQ